MDDTDDHDDDRESILTVDRLGTVLGASMNVMPDGVAAPFETRSMPPEAQGGPYARYVMRGELPPGWTIRSTTVPPSSAIGSVGGAVELQVVDGLGRWVRQELHQYRLAGRLPTGWHIEISEARAALGRPGGALQVRILDSDGDAQSVASLKGAQAKESGDTGGLVRPLVRDRR